MTERFSTNFVDFTFEEASHQAQGTEREAYLVGVVKTPKIMETTAEAGIGFTDSFVEPSAPQEASGAITLEVPVTGASHRFSDSFADIESVSDADHLPAFETKDSPTSSQENLSQKSHSARKPHLQGQDGHKRCQWS